MKKIILLLLFPLTLSGQVRLTVDKLTIKNSLKFKDSTITYFYGDSIPNFKWVRENSGGLGSINSGLLKWIPDSLSFWPYANSGEAKAGGIYKTVDTESGLDGYNLDTGLYVRTINNIGLYGNSTNNTGVYGIGNIGIIGAGNYANAVFGSSEDSVVVLQTGQIKQYDDAVLTFQSPTLNSKMYIGVETGDILKLEGSGGDSIVFPGTGNLIKGYRNSEEIFYITSKGFIGQKYNELQNVGVGDSALNRLNYLYGTNTAIGAYSLMKTVAGSSNIGLGYMSGHYATNLSNRLFINSGDRTNLAGDTTKSIIYGLQATNTDQQVLRLNVGQLCVKGGRNTYKFKIDSMGYVYSQAPHAFSKFIDSTITWSLTQNTWYQITRQGVKTTWPASDYDGFTESGDTVTAQYPGHYILKYQINIEGVDSKVYEYRVMRKNGSTEEVWRYAVTGTGSTVLRDVSTYIDLLAGTKFWVELRSTSSAPGSVTLKGGQMRIYPIHLEL